MPRTLIASDNFDRAGPAIGSNWTQQNTGNAGDVSIDSSTRIVGQFSSQPTDQLPTVVWAGAGTFTDDQYASMALPTAASVTGGTSRAGVTVRSSGNEGTRSYYEAVIRLDSATTPTTELAKWVSGTRTLLHSAAAAWADNDLIELEAEGTTIRLLKNGTALGGSFTQTDSSITTGKPGASVTAAAYGDNWEGGNLTSATAPTIDAQPTAQTVTAPTAATFTASVGGTFTGLRWQRQAAGAGAWADVSGATSSTLTTGATSVTGGSWNNTDRVRLAVDWSGGTVLSNDVALTVNAAGTAPSITTQPSNASVTVGSTAGFTVAATGSGTLTYQWQREPAAGGGFADISGATSASYTTPATSISGGSANNGDKYRCVVTGDTSPPATSNQATLTVLQPLATTITFTITGATSLTGLKWAVFEGLTPDAWVAPIAKGAAESTNASDVCTVSIAGVTTKRVGDLACVVVTNSDGTATGGSQAATRRMAYYIGACA